MRILLITVLYAGTMAEKPKMFYGSYCLLPCFVNFPYYSAQTYLPEIVPETADFLRVDDCPESKKRYIYNRLYITTLAASNNRTRARLAQRSILWSLCSVADLYSVNSLMERLEDRPCSRCGILSCCLRFCVLMLVDAEKLKMNFLW